LIRAVLILFVSVVFIGCSQNQKTTGKNIIKTGNIIKGLQNTTLEGIKESAIVKTKDILDLNRGGGF